MEYDYHEIMKLNNQLCFPLYAAARNVTSLYTPWLKPLGLTYTQYITFLVLWEKDGISVSEERNRSSEDDRVVIVTLTQKGRELQEQVKDIPEKVGRCIDLPIEKAKQLHDLLHELLQNQKGQNQR